MLDLSDPQGVRSNLILRSAPCSKPSRPMLIVCSFDAIEDFSVFCFFDLHFRYAEPSYSVSSCWYIVQLWYLLLGDFSHHCGRKQEVGINRLCEVLRHLDLFFTRPVFNVSERLKSQVQECIDLFTGLCLLLQLRSSESVKTTTECLVVLVVCQRHEQLLVVVHLACSEVFKRRQSIDLAQSCECGLVHLAVPPITLLIVEHLLQVLVGSKLHDLIHCSRTNSLDGTQGRNESLRLL